MDPLTDEQAEAVGRVIGRADSGCSVCVRDLCDEIAKVWPDRNWPVLAGLESEDGQ